MEGFIKLRPSLELMFTEEMDLFKRDRLSEILKFLGPLEECTMQIQTGHTSVHTAKTVILFLRSKMRNMSQDVGDVFQKWIDGNEIVEAIIHKCGSFYDMVEVQLVYEEDNKIDHAYNLDSDVRFMIFLSEYRTKTSILRVI